MSESTRHRASTARRGDGDAGMDARGRAMHGAIAEHAARAKARRTAWLLAGLAVLVYVGYMVWIAVRGVAQP